MHECCDSKVVVALASSVISDACKYLRGEESTLGDLRLFNQVLCGWLIAVIFGSRLLKMSAFAYVCVIDVDEYY